MTMTCGLFYIYVQVEHYYSFFIPVYIGETTFIYMCIGCKSHHCFVILLIVRSTWDKEFYEKVAMGNHSSHQS